MEVADSSGLRAGPEEARSLITGCAALRDEVARVIQKSRQARLLFDKRHVATVKAIAATVPAPNPSRIR